MAPWFGCRPLGAGVFIGVPPQTGGSIASTGSPAPSIPVRPLSGLVAKKKPAACALRRGDKNPPHYRPVRRGKLLNVLKLIL